MGHQSGADDNTRRRISISGVYDLHCLQSDRLGHFARVVSPGTGVGEGNCHNAGTCLECSTNIRIFTIHSLRCGTAMTIFRPTVKRFFCGLKFHQVCAFH